MERGAYWRGRLLERGAYFEILKNRNSDFHMHFRIKYNPSICEKYRIFNIDENIKMLRTKRQSTFYRPRVTHILFSVYELDKTKWENQS